MKGQEKEDNTTSDRQEHETQELNSWNEVENQHFDEEDEEEELVYLVSIRLFIHTLIIFECENLDKFLLMYFIYVHYIFLSDFLVRYFCPWLYLSVWVDLVRLLVIILNPYIFRLFWLLILAWIFFNDCLLWLLHLFKG